MNVFSNSFPAWLFVLSSLALSSSCSKSFSTNEEGLAELSSENSLDLEKRRGRFWRPNPTVTPIPTATPVATPAPTATPIATATPVATPAPTATPVATPIPSATPIATPAPTVPPVSSASGRIPGIEATAAGTYPVYQGCEAPSNSYSRTLYIDPAKGSDSGAGTAAAPLKTLEAAFASKKILAGDHVILLAGDHGWVQVTRYNNAALMNASQWIWLDFQNGASVETLNIQDMNRWKITNAKVAADSGNLVYMSGGGQFVLADSTLTSVSDSANWTADDWIGAANGFFARNTECISLLRNKVINVRFGLEFKTDDTSVSSNQLNILAADNEIRNYSGDGIRPNASNVTLRNNLIIDAYVDEVDGDYNHDDAIQGFALNGAVYNNLLIEGTFVQESSNPNRPLPTIIQGISAFDGKFTNVVIRKNVVLASEWHGISWNNSENVLIEKNTVLSSNSARDLWVSTGAIGKNNIIRDNIMDIERKLDSTVQYSNNYVVPDANQAASHFMQFDLVNLKFDLRLKSSSSMYGKGAGAY